MVYYSNCLVADCSNNCSCCFGGGIIGCLVTYCIVMRQASVRLTADDQPKGSLYEEVSQPKMSEQMFEMGDNVAYGPVRH